MKKILLISFFFISLNAQNTSNNKIPYKCKNKIYCSQMKSCKEAKYYLKVCGKYAKMDGDKDGIPCERQWCNINR